MKNQLVIKGAREHNLKNVDLSLPRDKLIVFTGLSGSGKSSLAFDTIYAEGQRRYVESLSSYARQFLGQMNKPDVDSIDGLSPAISIDQKTTSNNPRSTVGTVTEINDYLRLLYSRIGVPHCPVCGRVIASQSVDQMIESIVSLGEGTRIQIMAPVVRQRKGEHVKLFDDMIKQGYVRARVDGEMCELSDRPGLNKQQKHTIEIVIDRLIIRNELNTRLTDSIETAARLSGGLVLVNVIGGEDILFSQNYACPECGISIEELAPRMFSFNSPFGACPTCMGLGVMTKVDPDMVIPDKSLSINQGAISISGWNTKNGSDSFSRMYLEALSEKYGFSLDTPVSELPDEVVNALLYGTGGEKLTIRYDRQSGSGTFTAPFEGVVTNLERRFRETSSDYIKEDLSEYMAAIPCPVCHGKKLKPESLAVTVADMSIADMSDMSVRRLKDFLTDVSLTPKQEAISGQILKEIRSRLSFLSDVGLDYLTLSRQAASLSGGEAQRIRLATQIGSSLVGVLY
ncbi:MAG: excinuclease ABC subunit UvrA, partial [Clostridia bacterium]|nr:excinuclease ABC subunit UvrA [Clostridia bacterium]